MVMIRVNFFTYLTGKGLKSAKTLSTAEKPDAKNCSRWSFFLPLFRANSHYLDEFPRRG